MTGGHPAAARAWRTPIIDRDNVVSAGTELRGTPDNVLVKEKGSERE